MTLTIRPARPGEEGLVLSFVRELAEYEKLLHEVEADEAPADEAPAHQSASTEETR